MLKRIAVTTAAALLLTIFMAAQQRQGPQPQRITTELVVRVSYEDDRAVGSNARVQVTNSSGVPVAENFTRSEGEARFIGLEPGMYRLRISGIDIEEKFSEYSFTINPREMTHVEYVRVRRRGDSLTSTEGSVSAAELNIPPKAKSEFEKGLKALNKQNQEEALQRFARAIELYPRYAAAINNMGVIAMQQGRKDEGLAFFRQAVKVDDQFAPPYLNLAKAVVANKDYAEAEQLLLKGASLDPTNVEMIAILAMIEFESNKLPRALASARKVHGMPHHEKFAFAHYIVGRVLESQNHGTEALAEYRLFLKESPNSASAPNVRGFIAALEQQKQ